jgi:hypothetical protein
MSEPAVSWKIGEEVCGILGILGIKADMVFSLAASLKIDVNAVPEFDIRIKRYATAEECRAVAELLKRGNAKASEVMVDPRTKEEIDPSVVDVTGFAADGYQKLAARPK